MTNKELGTKLDKIIELMETHNGQTANLAKEINDPKDGIIHQLGLMKDRINWQGVMYGLIIGGLASIINILVQKYMM